MNRRELLTGLGALAATCGGVVETIEPEPLPLLLVLRVDTHLSSAHKENIRAKWDAMKGEHDLPPLVLLEKGATLEAVLDPRGKNHDAT